MPNEDNKISKFCPGQKLLKIQLVIYIEFEKIFEKTSTSDNNPEASYTADINKHAACALSVLVHCLLNLVKIVLKINKIFIEELICNLV